MLGTKASPGRVSQRLSLSCRVWAGLHPERLSTLPGGSIGSKGMVEAPSPAKNSGAATLEFFQSLPVFSNSIL